LWHNLPFDKVGRGRAYSNILETIDNAPLVRMGRLANAAGAEVLADAPCTRVLQINVMKM
jgi:hypothetical protein